MAEQENITMLSKRVEDLLETENQLQCKISNLEIANIELEIKLNIYETLVGIYRKKSEFELNNLFEDFFLLISDCFVSGMLSVVNELPKDKKLEEVTDCTYESFRTVMLEDHSIQLADTGDYLGAGVYYARLDITEEMWLVVQFQE